MKDKLGRPAQDFLHDDSLRGILLAIFVPIVKLINPAARPAVTPTW